jgi:hypothetical protein
VRKLNEDLFEKYMALDEINFFLLLKKNLNLLTATLQFIVRLETFILGS